MSESPVAFQSSASQVQFSRALAPSFDTSSSASSGTLLVAASGPSSASPSVDSALFLLLSQLSASVQSLTDQVTSLQQPPVSSSSPPPSFSLPPPSAPASVPVKFEHPMGPNCEGNSFSSAAPLPDCSELFELPHFPIDHLPLPVSPCLRIPGFSLLPADANILILTDCAEGSRLSPSKLADGLSSGDVFLCSPTGGHIRILVLLSSTMPPIAPVPVFNRLLLPRNSTGLRIAPSLSYGRTNSPTCSAGISPAVLLPPAPTPRPLPMFSQLVSPHRELSINFISGRSSSLITFFPPVAPAFTGVADADIRIVFTDCNKCVGYDTTKTNNKANAFTKLSATSAASIDECQ